MENLLPAAKNIGTTHITTGCHRLHPVEWNVGEVAGSRRTRRCRCASRRCRSCPWAGSRRRPARHGHRTAVTKDVHGCYP
jgi:hypothetical protein